MIKQMTALTQALFGLTLAWCFLTAANAAPPGRALGWASSWTDPQTDLERTMKEISLQWEVANKTHDYKSVIALCDVAIRTYPHELRPHLLRAGVLSKTGQFDRAIPDCDAALQMARSVGASAVVFDALLFRARCFAGKHQWEAATGDLREAIKVNPKSPLGYNSLAWLGATLPDPKYRDGASAVQMAQRACALAVPERAEYLDTLAAAYAETNDFARAVATEKRAVSLSRDRKDTQSTFDKTAAAQHLALFEHKTPCREDPASLYHE